MSDHSPEFIEELWNLVARAQAGDSTALSDLYRHAAPALRRYAYFRTGCWRTADDLSGGAWVKAIRSLDRLQKVPGKSPVAWLMRITANVVTDHLKSAAHNRSEPVADVPESTSPEPGPEEYALRTLLRRDLAAALAQLTPLQRRAVELRYVLGYSIPETCRAMGLTEGALKALCYRATGALRRRLLADRFTAGAPRRNIAGTGRGPTRTLACCAAAAESA